MKDYEQEFEKTWRDIVCNSDGSLNLDQVMRELYDYSMMLERVPLVYDHVTGGQISKPNTDAFAVIGEADRRYQWLHDELRKDEEEA